MVYIAETVCHFKSFLEVWKWYITIYIYLYIYIYVCIYIYIYIYIYSPPRRMIFLFFPPVALRPNACHGLLVLENSGSHTTTHHIMCEVGVWRHILILRCVRALRRAGKPVATHVINICELLQVISVKVQVITPWWWILRDPKHVGVIFNYVSFKLLYDIDFNIYVLYNWVH